jgi:hypothetical protein
MLEWPASTSHFSIVMASLVVKPRSARSPRLAATGPNLRWGREGYNWTAVEQVVPAT